MEGDKNQNMQFAEAIFAWQFPEYEKYQKSFWWYVITLVVLIFAVWWLILDQNYVFAIFLVLFYLLVIFYDVRQQEIVDFIITPDGFMFGKRFYEYREISDFFIIYQNNGIKNLYFDFKNPLKGRLIVPIDGQNAVAVREYLLKYMHENLEREAEPLSEIFRRLLKF
ncbi:MAG: hypothetical protein WCP18_00110 [bacterium]